MTEISQRQLRNDNAEVLRGVESGESYVVTRRGVPVARLSPLAAGDLRCDRPASRRGGWSALPRVTTNTDTGRVLEDLRGER